MKKILVFCLIFIHSFLSAQIAGSFTGYSPLKETKQEILHSENFIPPVQELKSASTEPAVVHEKDLIIDDKIYIHDHQYVNMHLPFEPSSSYSYTQSIIPRSRINRKGTITKILFNFNAYQTVGHENLDIYLGTTSKNGFSSNTDWIPISQLTKVNQHYSYFSSQNTWVEIEIKDFYFDNTKNLVIAVHDKDYSAYSTSTDFYCTSIPESNASIYYYSASSINSGSPPSALGRLSYIPNIGLNFSKFDIIDYSVSNVTGLSIGDINADGFMDGILVSNDNIVFLMNDGANGFTVESKSMPSNAISRVLDCDNDNDVDIPSLINGNPGIYINDGGAFYPVIFDYGVNLTTCNFNSNDYDNDGDQDIFLTAMKDGSPFLQIYENEGNHSFSKPLMNLGQMDGPVIFDDFDRNNQIDILLTGKDRNNNYLGRLYLKKDNDYIQKLIQNGSMYEIFTTDLDFDGDVDLLNQYNYWENSNSEFTYTDLDSKNLNYGSGWVDIDSDGDLDFLYGNSSTNLSFASNNGNFNFTNGFLYTPIDDGMFKWYDFDHDGDMDNIYLQGSLAHHTINHIDYINHPPSIPVGLTSAVSYNTVALECSQSVDPETNSKNGIKYNYYVMSAADNSFVLSPNARLLDGKPLTGDFSNGFCSNKISLQNLPPGDYYWGVQSIDNSNACSKFSTQGSFTIKPQFIKTNDLSGSFLWGDTDNDGDLDFFSGAALYVNQGNNSFTSTQIYDYPATLNNADFGDYDNDGDIDLIFSSYYNYDGGLLYPIACIYTNQGNNNFNPGNFISLPTYGADNKLEWGDIDNDGDLDIICLSDDWMLGTNTVLEIYENRDNGDFLKHIIDSRAASESRSFAIQDIDKDLDLDIITSGDTAAYVMGSTFNPLVIEYENDGNFNFIKRVINIEGKYRGYIYSVDMNNDCLPDIISTGQNKYRNYFNSIYAGDGSFTFELINDEIQGNKMNKHSFGDVNNDGYTDFVMSGLNISFIYENEHNFNFEILNQDNKDIGSRMVSFCDFNGDFNMDIIGSGSLYKNNYSYVHLIPEPPNTVSHILDPSFVTLSWEKTDNQLKGSHTFNVRVGTSLKGIDVVAPESNITSGKRRIQKNGNVQYNTSFRLKNLPKGKYYWSVQSINANFEGSAWSGIDSFIISDLTPKFSFDTVCAGSSTRFTDESSCSYGKIIQWFWDFGDGQTSTLQSPTHIYQKGGTYKVSLTIRNANDENSLTRNVMVLNNADVDFNVDIICAGNKTTFANKSDTKNITISSWLWSFGDGDVSSVQGNVQHPYLAPGEYQAKLKIAATNGCIDSLVKNVTVGRIPNAKVSLVGYPVFCKGDSCELNVEQNNTYNYQWKLNNFNISGATVSQLKIKNSGNYTAVIINPVGNCVVESEKATITSVSTPDPPAVTASLVPAVICSGDSVRLGATHNPDYDYQWRLNEGTISSDTNVFYAKTEGNYTLEVSVGNGCKSPVSAIVFVDVLPPPDKPTIEVNGPTGFCKGDSVILSISVPANYTCRWGNNNGYLPGMTTRAYKAKESGNYYVEVVNPSSCTRVSDAKQVIVSSAPDPPSIIAGGAVTFCEGDSVLISTAGNPGYTYQWKYNGGNIGSHTNKIYAKLEGNYKLEIEVSGVGACSKAESNTIKVATLDNPDKPSVNLDGPSGICPGDTVKLSVPPTAGYTYQWRFNENNLSGATEDSYPAILSGNYSIRITNPEKCSALSNAVRITVSEPPAISQITALSNTEICQGGTVTLEVPYSAQYTYQWNLDGIPLFNETGPTHDAASDGLYTVDVANNNCSVRTQTKAVSYKPGLPKPTLDAYGPNAWYFVCSTEDAQAYRWYYNGNLVAENKHNLYYAGTSLGEYYVEVNDGGECFVPSDKVVIPVVLTGIDQTDSDHGMYIYPNPNNGHFYFCYLIKDNNRLKYRLMNINGNEILHDNFDISSKGIANFDFNIQSDGIYFIEIFNDDSRIFSGKLIIKK